jgi:hypothetical protein
VPRQGLRTDTWGRFKVGEQLKMQIKKLIYNTVIRLNKEAMGTK